MELEVVITSYAVVFQRVCLEIVDTSLSALKSFTGNIYKDSFSPDLYPCYHRPIFFKFCCIFSLTFFVIVKSWRLGFCIFEHTE